MNKYKHMSEAWGIEGNPFPPAAIHQGDEPYNPAVFSEEQDQFYSRLIYGAAMDRRGFGFLWSKGQEGEDTGFGKTTLLKHGTKTINADLGQGVFKDCGMSPEHLKDHRAIAAYASLNTMSVTGVYPILFAAVEYLADPPNGNSGIALIDALRAQIREKNELQQGDSAGLEAAIRETRKKLGATLVPLREDAMEAFCHGNDGQFADYLATVTPASRIRNGLAYFDFAFTVAAAAGVRHVFVLVDQLEDLATSQTVTRAKRSREVGRLRDIIAETQPFVGRVHFVFTFHIRAAHALLDMWVQNRLPSFDAEDPANEGSVVVLRGIRDMGQVRNLLITYLESRRLDGETGELAPFSESTLPVLFGRSGGRAGMLLAYAHKLFDRAAEAGVPDIDGTFAADLLGTGSPGALMSQRSESGDEPRDSRALDELLR